MAGPRRGVAAGRPREEGSLERAIKRIFALLALFGLMYLVRGLRTSAPMGAGTATSLGFLLLAAYVGGQLAAALELSRITGYILVGLLVGPGGIGLLGEQETRDLRFLNDVAIALIALTAGAELSLTRLRGAGRYILSITATMMLSRFVAVAGAVLLLAPILPFTAGRELPLVLAVSMVFGSVAIASSPSVAIAVVTDTRSRGPASTTILGVTVTMDVIVIVAFAVALAVAHAVLSPAGSVQDGFALDLAWEIGGSLLVGTLLGAGIAGYLRWIGEHMVFFTLAVAWLAVELAGALHLEVLLTALAAGFALENLLPVEGRSFVEALESASLPVYALFFSMAGTAVHLDALASFWYLALLLVAIRAAATWLGAGAGARLGGAPQAVRRYAWLGFISQAGVTLGMVTIVARSFPSWGEPLRALFVAMIAIHEIIGPVALGWALRQAGELGAGRGRGPRVLAPRPAGAARNR